MERQLANLTGLVQKALTQNVPPGPPAVQNQNYLSPGQYRGILNINKKNFNFTHTQKNAKKYK